MPGQSAPEGCSSRIGVWTLGKACRPCPSCEGRSAFAVHRSGASYVRAWMGDWEAPIVRHSMGGTLFCENRSFMIYINLFNKFSGYHCKRHWQSSIRRNHRSDRDKNGLAPWNQITNSVPDNLPPDIDGQQLPSLGCACVHHNE